MFEDMAALSDRQELSLSAAYQGQGLHRNYELYYRGYINLNDWNSSAQVCWPCYRGCLLFFGFNRDVHHYYISQFSVSFFPKCPDIFVSW